MTSIAKHIVLLAIVLNFGLRYYYVFHYAGFRSIAGSIAADAEDYLQIAYVISKTGRYGRPQGLDVKKHLLAGEAPAITGPISPDAWRPPVWPILLGLMLKVSQYNLKMVYYLRFLLDCFTLLLFWRLLLHLNLKQAYRALALLLLAIHPSWLVYSGTLLTEPVTILIHVGFVLCLLQLIQVPDSARLCIATGFLAALTILVHPYYAFFPFIIISIFVVKKMLNFKHFFLLLSVLSVTLLPWVVRNMLLYRTYKPILTTSMGLNIAKGWNTKFLDAYRNSNETTLDENTDAGAVKIDNLNQFQRSEFYANLGCKYIQQNWSTVPAIVARKFKGAITPFPDTDRMSGGILEAGRIWLQVISFVPLVIVVITKVNTRLRLIAVSAVFGYLVTAVIAFATIRYRFPLIWIETLSVAVVAEFGMRHIQRIFGFAATRQTLQKIQ